MEGGAHALLEAGRDATRRSAWPDAFEALTGADAESALGPQDLESLGRAAWCSGHHDEAIRARERAYAAYLDSGDPCRAAYMALTLRDDYLQRGARSIGAGWLRRAERLLQDEPECAVHGWLALATDEEPRAIDIARRFNDHDLEAWALVQSGYGLVGRGETAEGLARVDEACAAIAADEVSPAEASMMYCLVISVCHDLGEYGRAREWNEIAHRYYERFGTSVFPAICRLHRAEIMDTLGSWDDAEREARSAIDETEDFWPRVSGYSFRELGDIRLRRGDLAGAEEALRRAHEVGVSPQPGLALLHLAQGQAEVAARSIAQALADDDWSRLERARYLLPAQVEIAIACGDLATARSAIEEMEQAAADAGSPALEGTVLRARGKLHIALGDAVGAIRTTRRGLGLWHEVESPYETARSRMVLAEGYLLAGDPDSAAIELEAARTTFERLGATPDARRAAELIGQTATRATPRAIRTFMFTDIVGSTALIEVVGDQAWEDLRRWHDQSLRTCFAEHGAEEIDHAGDGFFIAFPDAHSAVECAVGIQRKLADHRRTHGFAPEIRIGLHASEAIGSGGTYTGKGVHAAARIAALARGGEVLASRETADAGAGDLAVSEPREVTLKGISNAVEIVSIDWR